MAATRPGGRNGTRWHTRAAVHYYGCMYTRPRHIFPEKDQGPGSESTSKPHFLDDLLAAAGAGKKFGQPTRVKTIYFTQLLGLALGEEVLEHWAVAHGQVPASEKRESLRLLALHRQGCTDAPSFNACRETCPELVYHYNLVTGDPRHPAAQQRARMMTMVANHLFLFVAGKMQVAELGDFCCASRPLRQDATPLESA